MNIGDATRFHKDSARNMILNCLPKGQEENWIIVSAKEARNLTMDDVSVQQREIRQDRIINSAETTHNVDVYSIIPERFRDGSFDWVGHESEVSAIRKDLLERLKIEARKENRSLNNYVESVLLDAVYREPNEETLAAMEEARDGKDLTKVDTSSLESFLKSLE